MINLTLNFSFLLNKIGIKKADKISAKFYAQQTGQFLLMQYRNHKFTTKAKSFLILSTATLDDNVCNVS